MWFFMLKKMLIPLFCAFSLFSAPPVLTAQRETQVRSIDQQIQELQDKKMGFEARAIRHENQADRLQFNDETYLETRRHIQLAEENRAKAAAIQQEIDRLQNEKDKIINTKR